MFSRTDKLKTLAELDGFSSVDDLLHRSVIDAVSPGICMNEGCDFTAEYEPDQEEGWCEICDTNTVASALILAGLI